LDLLALGVVIAFIVTGGLLLWRRLPRAAAAMEPVCVACGAPARSLAVDTFICRACARDVRDDGVAVLRPSEARRPFWRVVWFSAVLCLVAAIATSIVLSQLPTASFVSGEVSVRPSAETFRSLEFTYDGRRGDSGLLKGELDADLVLPNGDRVTLEVQSPSMRYRIVDAAGREAIPLSPPSGFDETAVRRWMAAGGLDPTADRKVAERAELTCRFIINVLRRNPDGFESFRSTGDSTSWSSFNSDGRPPPDALPIAVMIWSAIWLAGIAHLLRPFPRDVPVHEPAGVTR
jgi:hypothetical protein